MKNMMAGYYNDLRDYVNGERQRLNELTQFVDGFPTEGFVEATYLTDRGFDSYDVKRGSLLTEQVEELEIDREGIIGDRHRRLFRPSSGRERFAYPRGMPIREHRHVFAVSNWECRTLSDALGVEVTPENLGANLKVAAEGVSEFPFSMLPIGTHIQFFPETSNDLRTSDIIASMHVYARQMGCPKTGRLIAEESDVADVEDFAKQFIERSQYSRGLVLSIEAPGEGTATIRPGQRVAFRFPKPYTP